MQNFSHVFFRLGYPRLSPSDQLYMFPYVLNSMGQLLNSRSRSGGQLASAPAAVAASSTALTGLSAQLLSQVDSTFRMLLFVSLPLVVSSHAVCPRTIDALESLRARHLLSASSSTGATGPSSSPIPTPSPAAATARENSLFRVSDPRAAAALSASARESGGAQLSLDEMLECRTRCALADSPIARRRLLELLLDVLLLPYHLVDRYTSSTQYLLRSLLLP